jgi:hypothetical protein
MAKLTKADLRVKVEGAEPPSELEQAIQANEEFAAENARLHALLAKNTPVTPNKREFIAEDHQVGQDGIARFEGDELIHVEQRTLDDPLMSEKLSMLKFMEEPVRVHIHDVSEDQADLGFTVEVNGQAVVFNRGEEKTVARKFVEGLARAKKTSYRNQLRVDQTTGEQEYIHPSKTGLRYPFSVVEDRNAKGRDWLQAVLRQP